jgi:hypothetical protein
VDAEGCEAGCCAKTAQPTDNITHIMTWQRTRTLAGRLFNPGDFGSFDNSGNGSGSP